MNTGRHVGTARTARALHLAPLIAVIIYCSAIGLGEADDDDPRRLLEGLQSTSCEARRAEIAAYLGSGDNKRGQNAGLLKLSIADQELRDRVSSLLGIVNDDREGAARIAALAEQISRTESLPPAAQQLQLRQRRDELLRIVRNPDERFTARVGAPWLLTRVLRAGSKDNPGWIPQWRKELEEMLRGRGDSLRVIAAINAALGRFPEGSDPRTSDVSRVLVGGLQSGSPIVREMSHTGLAQIIQNGPCFEATDSAKLRASAVRDWEAWWKQNKPRLASQRIKQAFW